MPRLELWIDPAFLNGDKKSGMTFCHVTDQELFFKTLEDFCKKNNGKMACFTFGIYGDGENCKKVEFLRIFTGSILDPDGKKVTISEMLDSLCSV